jgi:hypothetical protein
MEFKSSFFANLRACNLLHFPETFKMQLKLYFTQGLQPLYFVKSIIFAGLLHQSEKYSSGITSQIFN